ncbi:MAG: triphosphoribosyl-dephospho-CoA synthase CitG [Bariatricus sp.]
MYAEAENTKKEQMELFIKMEQCLKEALLGEVFTTPKPGLVDLRDSGAHVDMDWTTFVKSAQAITPYLVEMAKAGYYHKGSLENLFLNIRKIGINAELAMFQATNGVNTHKGAIFTLGILGAAAGYCYRWNKAFTVSEILETARGMTERVLEKEFENMNHREPLTHGEKLYRRYGEKGIRGEAQKGFPIIGEIAYPAMKECRSRGLNWNLTNMNVLLYTMTKLQDTNVLSRGTYEELTWVKKTAKSILRMGGAGTINGYFTVQCMNGECIRKNISPGGAADILAATLFLCRLEELEL